MIALSVESTEIFHLFSYCRESISVADSAANAYSNRLGRVCD
jgi:hypothetical protein